MSEELKTRHGRYTVVCTCFPIFIQKMVRGNYELKDHDIKLQISNKHQCRALGIKGLENFYDVCIFNSITSVDLDVVIDGYLNSTSVWQKKFYVRSMILVLNEHLDKIHGLMNSKFYTFLSSNEIFNELREELTEAKKLYKSINREKYKINDLRNSVIGHRNKDAEKFLISVNEVNSQEIYMIVLEVQKILGKFSTLSTNVINLITAEFSKFYVDAKSMKL